MFISYPAIFYKDVDSEMYVVHFPDLDIATQGEDEVDAMYMAIDLLGCHFWEDYIEKREFPKPSKLKDIVFEDEDYYDLEKSFVTLVGFDMKDYYNRFSKKKVEVSVKVPVWLKELAERKKLNLSKILTKTIKDKFDLW